VIQEIWHRVDQRDAWLRPEDRDAFPGGISTTHWSVWASPPVRRTHIALVYEDTRGFEDC
jgi:hypothetical protein